MDSNKENNLIYVTAKQVEKATGLSKMTVSRNCRANKYQYREVSGNGGIRREILLSSLEPENQDKVRRFLEIESFTNGTTGINNACEVLPLDKNVVPFSFKKDNTQLSTNTQGSIEKINSALISFGLNNIKQEKQAIPEKEKQKALFKVDLITSWQEYRNSAKNKAVADKEFIDLYNSQLLNTGIYKKIGKTSLKTLYRWHKQWIESERDWKSLTNSYNFGSESSLTTTLTDLEKYKLLEYMLHQNKFKLSRAYELIKADLKRIGVTEISSLKSYRNVWNYVVRNYSDAVEFARNGMKSALDKQLPHITRDWTTLNVGDCLVGDGHTLDFMVLNPETSKPCRATLVGFLDDASRDLVGYEIMFTENTQCIASALRNSIINLGKMPKVVHLDNGRAFKGKTFTADDDYSQVGLQGIYAKLGIKTIFSKPYNGRSKIIERFFKELTESLAKLMPSYIGNNIFNQPASTKRNEKFHKDIQGEFVPTIEETKACIDKWLNEIYRQRKCLNAKNMTIAEYFNAGKGKGVDVDLLDDLMLTSNLRKIHRNGIKLFDTWYFCSELIGLKTEVVAKYNMFDLSYVKVYTKNNEYVGKAERVVAVHPYAELLGSAKDLAEYKQQQKAVKKQIKDRIQPVKKVLRDIYEANVVNENRFKRTKPNLIAVNDDIPKLKITCYGE